MDSTVKSFVKFSFIALLPSYTAAYIILHQVLNINTAASYVGSSYIGAVLNLILFRKFKFVD